MKTFNYPILKVSKLSTLFIMFMSTVLFTSCEKEEAMTAAPNDAEMAIFELLQTPADQDTRRKGAPAKGDDAIAAIAIAGGFSELVDALSFVDEELDAGLVNLFLTGTDQYTVFAPTDAAFAELYGVLGIESVRELPAELVLEVLLYHVTEGRRASNSVVPPVRSRTIETLLGETFSVNTAAVISAIGSTANIGPADISASNGIIHVIDSVLLPF
jgi:uncharacterized surface protein with fasciclin (FAS1) repeats